MTPDGVVTAVCEVADSEGDSSNVASGGVTVTVGGSFRTAEDGLEVELGRNSADSLSRVRLRPASS